MKTIETMLLEEVSQLERIATEARRRLKSAPKGRLRIMKKRGGVEYYYKEENRNSGTADKNDIHGNESMNCRASGNKGRNNNGRYMKKSEWHIARGIAQRDYDAQVVKKAEKRINAIRTFLEKYDETDLKRIYQKTNFNRRELLSESILSDSEFEKRWQEVEYEGKIFTDEAMEIITERGERVRSKSEKIIADKLYSLGIPYRYEYPLVLEGNIKIYPDFTILKMPERKEVYLEHFGMMDDGSYVDKVMYKLSTYERNGIYLGVNLFITYETNKKSLSTRLLDGLVRNLFYME